MKMTHVVLTIAAVLLLAGCGDNSPENTFSSAHETDEQSITLPNRRLIPLNNTLNFRDLGGYSTADGRRVKWKMLFRSDSLAHLDDVDLAYLEQLQLSAVTDFRSDSERAESPDRLPQQSPAIAYRTLAINNPAVDVAELGRKFFSGQLTEAELLQLTDRRGYINDLEISRMWGLWVRSLVEPGYLPQLFHCTAGKDRTGFAAAIVLLTLGVPREDVMQDFLLSNEYLAAKIEENVHKIQAISANQINVDVLRQVLGVSPQSLVGAIQAMEAKYGSIDGFIEHGLGIDAATRMKLQTLLLE
jgi:protein-tyrosine phosphatase